MLASGLRNIFRVRFVNAIFCVLRKTQVVGHGTYDIGNRTQEVGLRMWGAGRRTPEIRSGMKDSGHRKQNE